MAVFAIGDVQGCYDELARLLEQLNIDTSGDEVWFVGDLVNRGPRSLDVLRLVASMGKMATVTLGNHDLHLLAIAENVRPMDDSLAPVLAAADADEILQWLRGWPLAYFRPELDTLMVHAGVPPQWSVNETIEHAREVTDALQGPDRKTFLENMYGQRPDRWSPELTGAERQRFITNALTRTRFGHADGRLDFAESGPPGQQAAGLLPWFDLPGRETASLRIVCGHWSALGLLQRSNLLAIDTGCVWGRELTAVRLDGEDEVYSVPARN
jgi:bis(5'-nucleosyl)-tetraphosphatase (symmetrical)